MLIRLAGLRGWQLHRHPTFAGVKTAYWLARNGDHTRVRIGRCLAEVATDLFLEAMEHDTPRSSEDHTRVSAPPGRR